MVIDLRRVTKYISSTAILLVFSGYFFYHYVVAEYGAPRIFGGYFSPLILAFALLLVSIQLFDIRLLFNKSDFPFYFCIVYMMGMSLLYFVFGDTVESSLEYAISIIQSILISLSLYLILRCADFNSELFRKLVAVSFFIQLIMIGLISMQKGVFAFSGIPKDEVKVAGYQQIAMVVIFQSGLLMSYARNHMRIWLYILTSIGLFYVGARSEFIAFLLSGLLLVATNLKEKKLYFVYGIATVIALSFILQNYADLDISARTLSVLNIKNQTSYVARTELTGEALTCIRNSPFFGCYGADYSILGEGSYSHNILSTWQTYGFVVFALFSYMLISNLVASMRQSRRGDNLAIFAFYYSAIAVFMAIFSKSFFDPVYPISFGLAASMRLVDIDLRISKRQKNVLSKNTII